MFEPPNPGAGGHEAEAMPRRPTVLVVDDEPLMGELAARILDSRYEVVIAQSVAEALHLIGSRARFDVILCDLLMPDRTGMDLYDALGTADPESQRRIVFMTAGAFTQRARDFLDSVPNRRLEKPFVAGQLRVAVARALDPAADPVAPTP